MLKKILIAALFALCVAPSRADIATVAGVNEYIAQSWDITMPATSTRGVLDMSYLMTMIDKANEILNSSKTSDYSHNPEYATHKIVATNAATNAVDTLIQKKLYDPQFWFEPAATGDTYEFYISAKGSYTIYWGDGEIESIYRDNTTGKTYSHTYEDGKPASAHKIGLGGKTIAYSTEDTDAAISFEAESSIKRQIKSIDGCLGCIFGTIDDGGNGKQPRFYMTFASNSSISVIPDTLFNGISGAPISYMFYRTFKNCSSLTSLPENLFSTIQGAPADYMFYATFAFCEGLKTIPPDLFSGIRGDPAVGMFWSTFFECTGLTGKIPSGLFAGISGAPQVSMFLRTFYHCSNLTGIGDGLFGDINGAIANSMFTDTFYDCVSLTGPSATVGTGENKQFLYERWPGAGSVYCYTGATKLSDRACIPTNWGGAGTREPGTCIVSPTETEEPAE